MKLVSSPRRTAVFACALAVLPAAHAAAQQPAMKMGPTVQTTDPMQIQPMAPKPAWAPTIDPQMLAVIEQLGAFEQPPFVQMTAFQARNAKTPAEAVMALLKKTGIPPMQPKVDISHRILPVGSEQGVLTRIYTPAGATGPLPVIVYYHGGGWVIADLDTYEPSPLALAQKANAVVVSVAYRQAPENPFPAAHEDAFAAYKWVTENAAQIGGDPNRIATAGESAGGNLAVAVPLMAKERGVKLPAGIISVYPIADGDTESPSYQQYADAKPLNKPLMAWFFDKYYPNWRTEQTPLISLTSVDFSGFPPTTIINAEIDPLQSEGGELAERMRSAGVDVRREVYAGTTHEFFGMAALLEQAVQAQDLAASRLKAAFARANAMGMPRMQKEVGGR